MNFKFGDVLANGYQSEDNPYHKCIFLRETKDRIHVMEFDGELSNFFRKNHKLTKVGSIVNEDEINRFKEEMWMKKRKYASSRK